MNDPNSEHRRFELKYLVEESTALEVRNYLAATLVLDGHCRPKPNYAYANHSIYLDSPQWQYYWETRAENPYRHKLRVRYYDDDPETPVYLEIKRRSGDLVIKQRTPLPRKLAAALLCGDPPAQPGLRRAEDAKTEVVREFGRLMAQDHAVPQLHLAYYRESWVNPANPAERVTIDRALCCEPCHGAEFSTDMKAPIEPWGKQVILKVKFTGHFPEWFWGFQHIFRLESQPLAKYATCISSLVKCALLTGCGPPAFFPGLALCPEPSAKSN